MNFDCDAMIYFENNLYLFSKNRTEPFDGIVKMYKIPDTPGDYTAKVYDQNQVMRGIHAAVLDHRGRLISG